MQLNTVAGVPPSPDDLCLKLALCDAAVSSCRLWESSSWPPESLPLPAGVSAAVPSFNFADFRTTTRGLSLAAAGSVGEIMPKSSKGGLYDVVAWAAALNMPLKSSKASSAQISACDP